MLFWCNVVNNYWTFPPLPLLFSSFIWSCSILCLMQCNSELRPPKHGPCILSVECDFIRKYFKERSHDRRILLVLDKVPGYPVKIQNLARNLSYFHATKYDLIGANNRQRDDGNIQGLLFWRPWDSSSPRQVVRTSHLFRVAGRVAILKRSQTTKVHHGSRSLKLCWMVYGRIYE